MPLFPAHIVSYFHYWDREIGNVPLWEKIVLIEAEDMESAALRAAGEAGGEHHHLGTLAVMGGRAGEVEFAGIRKIESELPGWPPGPRVSEVELKYLARLVGHGYEISSDEFTAPDLASVQAFANGLEVQLICDRVLEGGPWLTQPVRKDKTSEDDWIDASSSLEAGLTLHEAMVVCMVRERQFTMSTEALARSIAELQRWHRPGDKASPKPFQIYLRANHPDYRWLFKVEGNVDSATVTLRAAGRPQASD